MKTRSGFVSNSSSSSFIIFGERLEWYDIQKEWADDIWMCGSYVGEGYDVFKLTPTMVDLITKNKLSGNYYKAFKTLWPEESEDEYIKRDELPATFRVFEWDRSQHSVNSLDEFIRRYINNLDEN